MRSQEKAASPGPRGLDFLIGSKDMIVYGDSFEDRSLGVLTGHLLARVHETMHATSGNAAGASLRALLALTGQLEQAVADAAEQPGAGGPWPVRQTRAATASAAAAFYADWALRSGGTGAGTPSREDLPRALASLRRALADIPGDDRTVRVKVPEGFSFYALFPEQYAGAAARFVAGRPPGQALVVGLRSIGTALGAVVGAALAAGGWQVRTMTTRPNGPALAREVSLGPADVGNATSAFVVDEGPGLSGSSMAAAARALAGAGICPSRIVLFASHGGGPGWAASEEVRAFWRRATRCVLTPPEVLLAGRRIEDALASGLDDLLHDDAVAELADIGGGLWRGAAYPPGAAWPPAYAPFARPKYLALTRRGLRVLLRFEGFAGADALVTTTADAAAARQAARAASGFSPAPLGVVHGFVATPWIEGTPLGASAAREEPALLAQVGRYLAGSAGAPLSRGERAAGIERLSEMLRTNAREALGDAAASRAREAVEGAEKAARDEEAERSPRALDGRVAPAAWVRGADGRLWKVNCAGRDLDHTIAGRQGIAWDLAGAAVEWRLRPGALAMLQAAFQAAGGPRVSPAELAFHRAAYAALRLGICVLSAEATGDDAAERARLVAAAGRYRGALAAALGVETRTTG